MEIVTKNVEELIPYINNPRNNDGAVDAVASSIKNFGFKVPIIVDKSNEIVAGHTRLKAAKKLGMKEVPTIIADDLTDEQIKAFRLADNKVAEMADWNDELLDIELEELENLDVDMTQYGFEELSLSDKLPPLGIKDDDYFYFDREEIVEDVKNNFHEYKNVEEYVKNIMDIPKAKYEFNRLCQGYQAGYNISLLFNPHRLEVATKQSKMSMFEAINTSEQYREAFAKYIVNVKNQVTTESEYYKSIGIGSGGIQYVNEFQPAVARDIYKTFCKDGDKVLDPCFGWGGRTLGLASSLLNGISYVGSDPSKKTYQGILKLKEFLGLGDSFEYFNLPFEEMQLKENSFDFCFTSPPYFDTEEYSDDEEQSYIAYNSYEKWRDGFLHTMLDKILYALKPDAKALLNVGNVRYPIDEDIEDYLAAKGIKIERLEDFSLGGGDSGMVSRTGNDGQGEPFMLFTKPKN